MTSVQGGAASVRIPASSIRYRKEFNSANKDANETLENWYDRLKHLAERCQYGPHSEAFILHQFVCGLDVLILEYLHAEQKDLSLVDVFILTKNFERNNEPAEVEDVKPVLLSIKEEEQEILSDDDGDHFNDNTYSDSENEQHEPTNEAGSVIRSERKAEEEIGANEDAKTDSILAMVPFMAETVIEPHEIPRLFECYLCHKTWKTAGGLTYHFTCYHTIGKSPKCHLCGKWIKDPSNMVRHLNVHFETKQFECHICDFSFARAVSLRKHLLVHTDANLKQFKCSKCSKVFISKTHLKTHKKTHGQPAVTLSAKLDEINKKQKSKKMKANNGSFKCEICATAFEKEFSLNVHMKVHCETEWLCHLCGKKLMNKRNLIHHYRVHTNEKPFTCEDCGRAFSSKEKLKLHSKSHSGVRPHGCTLCDKSFIQKGHLVKHMKVHFPDEKFRFTCNQCPRVFVREDKFDRHVLTHAGRISSKTCTYCEKTFKTNNHRMEHERVHTGEKPYQCTICNKSFGQKSTLRGHLKIHLKPKVERPKKKRKPKQKVALDRPVEYSLIPATAAYLG